MEWVGYSQSIAVGRNPSIHQRATSVPDVVVRGGAKMRRSFLAGISLFAISACAPQPASPPAAAAPSEVQPLSYAAGSSANTTLAFDGTYNGVATQNITKGNTLPVAGGSAPVNCPNYPVPPALTIANGLAQIQVLNLTFQGYVTPCTILPSPENDNTT